MDLIKLAALLLLTMVVLPALDLVDDPVYRRMAAALEAKGDRDPNDDLRLAGLYSDARQYDKSEALYRKHLTVADRYPLIYANLSVFAGKQAKYAEAIAEVEKQLGEVEAGIRVLEDLFAAVANDHRLVEEIADGLKDMIGEVDKASPEEQSRVLHAFVSEVRLADDQPIKLKLWLLESPNGPNGDTVTGHQLTMASPPAETGGEVFVQPSKMVEVRGLKPNLISRKTFRVGDLRSAYRRLCQASQRQTTLCRLYDLAQVGGQFLIIATHSLCHWPIQMSTS